MRGGETLRQHSVAVGIPCSIASDFGLSCVGPFASRVVTLRGSSLVASTFAGSIQLPSSSFSSIHQNPLRSIFFEDSLLRRDFSIAFDFIFDTLPFLYRQTYPKGCRIIGGHCWRLLGYDDGCDFFLQMARKGPIINARKEIKCIGCSKSGWIQQRGFKSESIGRRGRDDSSDCWVGGENPNRCRLVYRKKNDK